MTKQNLIDKNKYLKGKTFDTALPQQWLDDIAEVTYGDTYHLCLSHFVWLYDDCTLGRPFPLDDLGRKLLNEYNRKKGTYYKVDQEV